VIGVGTDILEVERLSETIGRQGQAFLNRIFTPNEQKYCEQYSDSALRYAGRFAVKEAVMKAFGAGVGQGLSWLDIEVINAESGQPKATLSKEALTRYPNAQVLVSLSHCKTYATAVAIRTS
jgi:holo-[acyl-carrier protein] synthase